MRPSHDRTRRDDSFEPERSLAIDVKFHHIGITVTSPEQTLEFFDDVFGLVTGMVLQV
jgi:hypothetical protein